MRMNLLRNYFSLLKFLFVGHYVITFSEASKTPRNATLTDLSKCKLTQFGTDYMGSITTTAGGIRCQMWHSENPVHKVSKTITDKDFPERSLQLARNYCRNPTKDPRGPWCYTMESTLIDDACEIPLCNFGECRISGTGSEYGGTHGTTSSGKKCKSWDKHLKLAVNKTEKFKSNQFSDLSRNKAKNFCRNPDSSAGGPWCWVDSEEYDIVEKEYCSVPFCDDKDCLVYSKNASVYSVLTSLNNTIGNITIWIKLWNPADEQIGQARLLFTHLQVPTSAELIAQEWGAGVEIIISNSGSGQEYPRTDDDEKSFEETPNILLGSKWTALWVAWGGGFISVGHQGSTNPIFLDEFKRKNSISNMYPENFFQYGIMGTGVVWSMGFCEDTCEVHTTFGIEFIRVWPLLQSNSTHDLRFYVRASHKVTIQFTQTPAVPFPCLLIVIGQHDATLIMYQEKESSLKEILLDLETKQILNFWAWHEFTISIFGMAIQMFWNRDYGKEQVFSIEHHIVETVRWFSIGSENTIAYWTLFCAPTEADAVEAPWFPNCVASSSDSRYEGSQWTAQNQVPCIPWISDKIPKESKQDDTFIDGSALRALNKCRNPTNDAEGPFCYAVVQSGSHSMAKQYCPIRKCRSSGTANDYLGTLSVTRSGRKCARWVTEPEEKAAPKQNISLESLMARAFINLKEKRENSIKNSMLYDEQQQRWDDIGSRLLSESEFGYTSWTPEIQRVTNEFGKHPGSPGSAEDTDNSYNHHQDTSESYGITEIIFKSRGPRDLPTVDSISTSPLSSVGNNPGKPSSITPKSQSRKGSTTISAKKTNATAPIHKVDPRYLNDTLYPEQNARNASNYCRNPSRNVAGTWCYTTDPQVPQDLCNVRDCEKAEECIFLVRGHGTGRRLYVLPEYRSEGLHFSLKEWEPDRPDSITFVILSEDDVKSRFILKVGAMKNEKVLLYYETKDEGIRLVKEKTLPHLLYLGKWTGFVIRMARGEIKLYYEGAPYPLFEWKDPEPAKAFLPVYYYYSSELGNNIGVAFDCETKCHIEQITTARFTRILPISIWEKEETPSPHGLVMMLRGEGIALLPLLMLPSTPGYYALTLGEMGQWIYFIRNRHPIVHLLHKQDAGGPIFTPDTWTNVTIQFYNTTIKVLRNGTEVLHYVHNLPLLFYYFSIAVDKGGWLTWAANCLPTDIDGAPLDGGWSEWGPWTCSASCNGGMGVRKRSCDNPEPNIRGQPCLGPSSSSGHCNMNKCGDVADVTLALIKKRIRIQHESIIINEGDEAKLSADTDIVSALKNETPTAMINWSRNGIFLEEEEDRIKLEDTAVSMSYAVVRDSGVYTQTLHRVDDSHLIFKIITLAVIPTRSELVIRETLPFSITCNCVFLGYVYSDLKISWILNGKVFKDYGISTPIAVNTDNIPKANATHHGEWRCEVVQDDLNFKWTTNVIKVRVLGSPNWRTHLMEDKVTRPIFGWMPSEGFVAFSAFFLTILIVVGIVLSTIWYLRFQESLKYKNQRKKEEIDGDESFDDSETEKLIDANKKPK